MINVLILSSRNTNIVDCYGIDKCVTILNNNQLIHAKKIDIENIHELTNKTTDVLIIAGGEPTQIKLHLKGKGAQIIRHFILNGGGYIGICAGAVLAIPKAPSLELLQHVKTVNDNVWWDSGICGDIKLNSCELACDLKKQNSAIEHICDRFNTTNLFSYKNGPLLNIKQSKKNSQSTSKSASIPTPLATFNGPFHRATQIISNEMSEEINESVAILFGTYGNGSVLISSIHPEYETNECDKGLLDEMCMAVTTKVLKHMQSN